MIRMAHVGTLKNVDDEKRLFQTIEYMAFHHGEFLDNMSNHDDINLKWGRDFLKEDKKYDMIILYFLYRYPERITKNIGNDLHSGSDLHSPENWNKKLNESGAKFIFCFGDLSEVNSQFFGTLMNYDMRFIQHQQFRGFSFEVFKLKNFVVP